MPNGPDHVLFNGADGDPQLDADLLVPVTVDPVQKKDRAAAGRQGA